MFKLLELLRTNSDSNELLIW